MSSLQADKEFLERALQGKNSELRELENRLQRSEQQLKDHRTSKDREIETLRNDF